jgi:hypothetical protein
MVSSPFTINRIHIKIFATYLLNRFKGIESSKNIVVDNNSYTWKQVLFKLCTLLNLIDYIYIDDYADYAFGLVMIDFNMLDDYDQTRFMTCLMRLSNGDF